MGWGYNFYGQTTVPAAAEKVKAIAAGGDHSLALVAEDDRDGDDTPDSRDNCPADANRDQLDSDGDDKGDVCDSDDDNDGSPTPRRPTAAPTR